MSERFIDQYLSERIPGYPCLSSPRWSTHIQQVDSGAERANQRWQHPLHTFSLPEAIRDQADFEDIHDHWMVMRGPLFTFPFRDPLDFASVPLSNPNFVPVTSGIDQQIGIGDGVTKIFQLTKAYTRGISTYVRNITHPILSTIAVAIDDVDTDVLSPSAIYSVGRETGLVEFELPPSPGQVIKAGFLFDVPVRFASDTAFDGIVHTFSVGGFADVELTEIRGC